MANFLIEESLIISTLNETITGCKNRHNIRNRMWKKHRKNQEKLFSRLELFARATDEASIEILSKEVKQIIITTLTNLKNLEQMYLNEYCVDYLNKGPKNITHRREDIKKMCEPRGFILK